jgi:hypothetical protein
MAGTLAGAWLWSGVLTTTASSDVGSGAGILLGSGERQTIGHPGPAARLFRHRSGRLQSGKSQIAIFAPVFHALHRTVGRGKKQRPDGVGPIRKVIPS